MKRNICPGCSGNRSRVFKWYAATIYVECLRPSCRMSGPLGATEDAAVERWNALLRPVLSRAVFGET